MPWLLFLLIALAAFALLVAIPFVVGLLTALLVFLTPTVKLKVKLARFLIARPFALLDREMGLEVAHEVETVVRMRHGKVWQRKLYAKLYEKAWGE